jgi:hypothetical protein
MARETGHISYMVILSDNFLLLGLSPFAVEDYVRMRKKRGAKLRDSYWVYSRNGREI